MDNPSVRPVITVAPENIFYSTDFLINTNVQIVAIRLIRLCSTTHSLSTDMRSIALDFVESVEFSYTVTAPPNANIAPPGLYMLFALRDKEFSLSGETMLPSVAKIVKLS